MGFIRHLTLKFDTKKALLLQQRFRSLFRRLNISLIGCSPAEPISVSIQYRKFTKNKLTQFIEYSPNGFSLPKQQLCTRSAPAE